LTRSGGGGEHGTRKKETTREGGTPEWGREKGAVNHVETLTEAG